MMSEETQSTPLYLGRQPILGRQQQLIAYELFFRDRTLAADSRAEAIEPTQAMATVIVNAFAELSTNHALGPYRGFIRIDQELLFSDLIEALPPQRVTLEIGEEILPSPEVIARCHELHGKGFTLTIDDGPHHDQARSSLLATGDIIRVDVRGLDINSLGERANRLKSFGKDMLAWNVETAEQLAWCQKLGFDLFQGYFFAQSTIIAGKKLNPSQLVLIRLLALVLEDAETAEIENAFKLEPGLTVNMLRLTNSVSSGLTTRITSLRHAITILGRRQLQRWLQLLIYTNPKGGTQEVNPLLQLAATRGRLMELLADRLVTKNREFSDQAFMVGILSLMPALLGMAMADILEQLPVALRVKQALSEHAGQHGQLLRLAEATEQSDRQALDEAMRGLPVINTAFLDNCLAQALTWANNLGQAQANA